MNTDVILYTNPTSRGRIARWMLEETGCPYQVKVLEYGPEMNAAEYRSINPMGKVPAIRHGDSIVTECAAICAYLAGAFPAAGLAPEADNRANYYRWLFFAAGPLESAVVNKFLGFEIPQERETMVGYGNYQRTLDALEAAVGNRPYITGDSFSAADVYVGAHIGWGLRFGTIENREAFKAYWQRVSNRDAWLRANELDDALLPKEKEES